MSNLLNRQVIADYLVERLTVAAHDARADFTIPGHIPACHIKDLLPIDLATEIYKRFPAPDQMMLKQSIREKKRVAAQMDNFDPLLEEAVYAFQDSRVIALISDISGFKDLEPDEELYAGGLSLMSKGAFLRPHLDNSHDKEQKRFRVINALYYVTPNWREDYGGSLQLWDQGLGQTARTFPCFFNSLVIMGTGKTSWHSVNEIVHEGTRCCVSNYYFSKHPLSEETYFHATSFRSESGKGLIDLIMCSDNNLRTLILKCFRGFYKNPHVYKRDRD